MLQYQLDGLTLHICAVGKTYSIPACPGYLAAVTVALGPLCTLMSVPGSPVP
jgi:hypothetical protein